MIFSAMALAHAISFTHETPCAIPMLQEHNHLDASAVNNPLTESSIPSNLNLSEHDDSLPWGDSIHDAPGDFHRIYFQNIDGVRNDADEIDLYVSCMSQFQIGTFCWADPGLDFSQFHIRQKVQHPLRSYFTAAKSAFSSSRLPTADSSSTSGGYQPGGTFMATTNQWATRSIGTPLVDPKGLGCWSGISYLGKQGKRLAILTAYRSPRQQSKGGFGFFDQQNALLLSQGVKKPNVRRQFIVDICTFINNLQHEGHEILLSLDANETLGQEQQYGITHLMSECSLSNLHLQGPDSPPATYKYGANRKIDYMLGSPNIADSVRHAGYLAYDDGIFSKHRGLFVDLDFHNLMGPVSSIVPSKARRLRSEDPTSVDKYVEAFTQYTSRS